MFKMKPRSLNPTEVAESHTIPPRGISVRVKQKINEFWQDHYEDIIMAVIVFLLTSLAFGAGVIFGARFYEDAQININCPEAFWKK